MVGLGVDDDGDVLAQRLEGLLHRADAVDRDPLVLAAEEAEERGPELRELLGVGLGAPVEHHRGVDAGGLVERRRQAPAAAEAPADDADRRRMRGLGEEAARLPEILEQPLGARHRGLHQVARLVGLGRRLPLVEVDRERHVPLAGQTLRHGAHVVVQAPPLLDDEEPGERRAPLLRADQGATDGSAVESGVGDVLGDHRLGRRRCGRRARVGVVVPVLVCHAGDEVVLRRGRLGREGGEQSCQGERGERAHGRLL